jgi:hypothetical protein
MKILICDVCHRAGKQVEAKWKISFKKDFQKISADVCQTHKLTLKTWDQAIGCLSTIPVSVEMA